ncbi:hypothetical protein Sjap_004332 [Stephania japonica]|uniref:Uncharacterized protein n=1 Tax=Stephania japonica TaxID=461633 RepID=A0AAP0PIZ5_9MAGN
MSLSNDANAEGIIEKIKGDAEEFFRLPLEKKKAYAQQPGSVQGYGQAFVVSEEQKLEWSDVFGLRTFPIAERLTKSIFLIQVNVVEGLQIKKNGTWVPVKPVPGAFIVNIGDAIEYTSKVRLGARDE